MAQTPNNRSSSAPKKPVRKKKKGNRYARWILTALMVIVIVAASFLIYRIGKEVYEAYLGGDDNQSGGNTNVNPITYQTTPVDKTDKVAYYLFGVMGDEGAEGETDLLSMVCFDKKANTLRILQLPKDTYLGEDSAFKVKRLSEVFANPQDVTWCTVCRKRVYEPEQSADGKHTVCNTTLTTKEGSSMTNLAEVFNRQFALPVDGIYLFEQETFLKLVDLVDGVNVNLAFAVTVDDVTYEAGPRAIDGQAALQYIAASGTGVEKDIDRFARFQQVCTALMQRLFVMDDAQLASLFQPLMVGSTPIRVEFGDGYEQIVQLVRSLSQVSFDNMTAYVLPGEEAQSGDATYYSVHKDEVLALLNEQFNPHEATLGEEYLLLTELSNNQVSDRQETVLSTWVMEQNTVATPDTDTN